MSATAAPGDLDPLDLNIVGAYVTATATQPDGKTIIAGKFSSILGVPRNNIARINANGTLDPNFDPNVNDEVYGVVVQPDGKILIGGRFTTLQPNGAPGSTARQYVARLNSDGTLDNDFDPKANNVLYGLALQPDGKVLLAGEFTTLQPNGNASTSPRQYIARVNADGTLDPAFDPKANTNVRSVAVQPDGKILLVGAFTTLQPNGAPSPTSRQNVARVNADGSLDPGFDPKANNAVYSLAVQNDGKILLGGLFTSLQPNGAPAATVRSRMARVNTDGSLDTAFDPSPDDAVLSIAIQTDGKIVVGGGFYVFQSTLRRGIARLNTDGTVDSGFDPKTNNTVLTVAIQTDGKVLLGGTFTTLQPNGAPATTVRNYFARLQNDAATQTLTVYDPTHIVWQRSGAGPEVSRATFDLSADNGATWNPLGVASRIGTSADWELTGLSLPPSGQLRARGVTTNGYQNSGFGMVEQVATYSPAGNLDSLNINVNGNVYATAVQPDGKLIIAGDFSSVLGVFRNKVARLNANGTLDMGFDPRASAPVYCVAVQPDGKILLGGAFFSLQPNGAPSSTSRSRIARVNADGTLDTGFDPKASDEVYSVAVQNDGKILLGGAFFSLQPNGAPTGTFRSRIARVNADGSLDTAFDPQANNPVFSMAVQPDGKILLGGSFSTLQPNGAPSPTSRLRIARLNADGTLDTVFNPTADNLVWSTAMQSDGKILIGGQFSTLQPNGAPSPTSRPRIARVNSDGTLDTGFNPTANDIVYSIAVQTDGKVLVGGAFTTLQPNGAPAATTRRYIARVNADGTLDSAFDPSPDNTVYGVALQPDGKVLLGGAFNNLQPNGAPSPTSRVAFARLLNDNAAQTLSVPDSTQILWQRTGAGPEISRATFELSTDGGSTWSPLGIGNRIGVTPNWQLAGLSLPVSGRIRARGITSNGYFNGGSGLIEQIITYLADAEIAVYQPAGVSLTDNASTIEFAAPINYSSAKTFLVRNLGGAPLTGLDVTKSGGDAAVFTIDTTGLPSTLAPGASGTFRVIFSPAVSGPHSATILISSNDADENPFGIALTGQGLTFNLDSDGDGLSDAAEFLLAALGFDWQTAQPGLVQTLFGGANGAGLYTTSQIQALNAGTPLLVRDPNTGKFKLTLALQKSTTLSPLSWSPFAFTQEGLALTGDGMLEFQFSVPDNTAFFRLEAH